MATFYTFDGNKYDATPEGEQQLLSDVDEAIREEVYTDASIASDEEREEAISMSYDGTHYQREFWDNMIAIMQMAPCDIDVKREEGPDDGQEAPCKHCGATIIYQAVWDHWEHYDSGDTWCADDEAEAEPKE